MTLSVIVENSMTLYASPTRPEWPERAAAYRIQVAGEFQCSLIEAVNCRGFFGLLFSYPFGLFIPRVLDT